MKPEGPLFRPVKLAQFPSAVKEFLAASDADPSAAPNAAAGLAPGTVGVPVPVDGRTDLAQSLDLAEQLYDALHRPRPLDLGIVLGADRLPDGLAELAGPLATEWLPE
ncbi:hypothetical protein VR45_33425, partial [Streptomyces sp. NRRL S-495]